MQVPLDCRTIWPSRLSTVVFLLATSVALSTRRLPLVSSGLPPHQGCHGQPTVVKGEADTLRLT
jgi:hypothetical protein